MESKHPIAEKRNYQNALNMFFNSKGLRIDENTLSAIADRLYLMETTCRGLEFDDDDDDDQALAEEARLAKKARALEKRNRNKSTKNYYVRRNFIMQGKPSEFMQHAEDPFRELITKLTIKNGRRLNSQEDLTSLLTYVLTKKLGLEEKDYIRIFPALMEKLVALEEKMWLENHPVAVDLLAAEEARLVEEQARLAAEEAARFEGLSAEYNQQGSIRYLHTNDADNAFAAYQTRP
jgi:hypothetical protein